MSKKVAQEDPSLIINLLKTHKNVYNVSLYDHLCKLFQKVLYDPGKYSDYENFELLSNLIKRNDFIYKSPKPDSEVNEIKEDWSDYTEWISKVTSLFSDLKGVQTINTQIPNLLEEAKMLEWAGVGLGEDEIYRISKSIAKLAIRTKATEIRFWGKILGTEKDYYISEGKISNNFSDEVPEDSEPKGVGVNALTFWVTDNILDDWVELPLITPEHIIVSRQIKRAFTGNLNAEITSFPTFPGREKHLLKAQVVRITYANLIAPKGLFKTNDENDRITEFEEEFKYPEIAELANLETWVRIHPAVLLAGRVEHSKKLEESPDKDEILEKDPVEPRLKAISEDRPFEPFETNWLVRTAGDTQVFNLIGKDEGNQSNYSHIVLKNITWPGAVTVANNKSFVNFYVGYAIKRGQPTFDPLGPQDIPDDPEDFEEQPEPNPLKEVEKIEPDSDEEKKNQEGEEEAGEADG